MAELKERGLKKSVGTAGLFATAYGNVGSSIYYALGLVAAHALGLTPVVFIFAGGLFALTAKTYAEGASMYPEAGGSSSFARHAFNEVVSFFAGWGCPSTTSSPSRSAPSSFLITWRRSSRRSATGRGTWSAAPRLWRSWRYSTSAASGSRPSSTSFWP